MLQIKGKRLNRKLKPGSDMQPRSNDFINLQQGEKLSREKVFFPRCIKVKGLLSLKETFDKRKETVLKFSKRNSHINQLQNYSLLKGFLSVVLEFFYLFF